LLLNRNIAVYTFCKQDIETLDVASQQWQQVPALLASLLSYPHVRADPLGAQCLSAVCDLMALAQTAATAAVNDDNSAQDASLQRKCTGSMSVLVSHVSF
jgi:hypothetical protein